MSKKDRAHSALISEYEMANSAYLTYDGFRWQAGAFLIAGVFVYWGLFVSVDPATIDDDAKTLVAVVSTILLALLMSCWVLFAHHYRQLYMFKLERIHELEKILNMEQHRRLRPGLLIHYTPTKPKGHNLDIAVYIFTSLGGGLLAWAKLGFSVWDLAVVPLVAGVVIWVWINEHNLQRQLQHWRTIAAVRDGG